MRTSPVADVAAKVIPQTGACFLEAAEGDSPHVQLAQGLPPDVRLFRRFLLGLLTGWSWTALIAPCRRAALPTSRSPPGCSQVLSHA
jgi:hypothetical protein